MESENNNNRGPFILALILSVSFSFMFLFLILSATSYAASKDQYELDDKTLSIIHEVKDVNIPDSIEPSIDKFTKKYMDTVDATVERLFS